MAGLHIQLSAECISASNCVVSETKTSKAVQCNREKERQIEAYIAGAKITQYVEGVFGKVLKNPRVLWESSCVVGRVVWTAGGECQN